jgi:hypothetical protein
MAWFEFGIGKAAHHILGEFRRYLISGRVIADLKTPWRFGQRLRRRTGCQRTDTGAYDTGDGGAQQGASVQQAIARDLLLCIVVGCTPFHRAALPLGCEPL